MIDRQIDRWADDLIDLTGRNRLLYFKHTRSRSLEFSQEPDLVESRLDAGWRFYLPEPPAAEPDSLFEVESPPEPEPPQDDQLCVSMQPERYRDDIVRCLRNLKRQTRQLFLDRGLWLLHMGLGVLRWTDNDNIDVQSPLFLVPVELSQTRTDWKLKRSDYGEPVFNPALTLRLKRDFDIEFSLTPQEIDTETTFAKIHAGMESAIRGTEWTIEPRAVLDLFTFHKMPMYDDLKRNRDCVGRHPTVRLLAEGPSNATPDLSFDPVPEEDLDRRQPPEDLQCVLDADASQRQCIAAASDERSFVMDGPPGTGKSQTITNIISQLLADGRTVLFVSEKAAALDVVHSRMAERKLDSFVLALHSHAATRKAVATELGKALSERPNATEAFNAGKRARLLGRRRELSAYATAVNELRRPLEKTLHDAIGRVSQLDDLPDVGVPEFETSDLDADRFARITDAAGRLGRAWGPVTRRDDFLWQELRDPRGGPVRRRELLALLDDMAQALNRLDECVRTTCDELALPDEREPGLVPRLVAILELVEERHHVDPSWLSEVPEAFADMTGTVDELVAALREHHSTEQTLRQIAPQWIDLSPSISGRFDRLEQSRIELTPSPGLSENTTAASLREKRLLVGQVLEIARGASEHSDTLAHLFRIAESPTLDLLERLVGLGRLVDNPDPPEESWLSAAGHSAAVRAHEVLRPLLVKYKSHESQLADVFTEDVLELDLPRLRARFDTVHTGLRKLGPACREDRHQLAGAALTGTFTRDLPAFLPDAISWQEVHRRLTSTEAEHAGAIGDHYWPPRLGADLARRGRAVEVAGKAVELAGSDVARETLVGLIGRGASPDPSAATAVHGAAPLFEGRRLASLAETLGLPEAELRALPLASLTDWLEGIASLLDELVELLDDVEEVTGADHDSRLGPARRFADLRAAYDTQGEAVDRLRQGAADALAGLADEDDPDVIHAAATWARSVRSQFEAAPESATADALLTTDLTHAPLLSAHSAWEAAQAKLTELFGTPYSDHLAAYLSASFEQARALIERLRETIGDVDEWAEFVTSRDDLRLDGLSDIVEAAIQRSLADDQVEGVIERSVLQSWIDHLLQADHRLQRGRAVDREAIVDEFRSLDKELVADAAARVINTCTSRRPDQLVGPYRTINQQAQLKKQHMPVRRLLRDAGDAAQSLKPCFMMSPLSVSQFLPPTLTFDVVIFDEASQIREADAICCIYRGKQLIVAGDQKQLPPTNFFQRTADLDEEITDDEDALLDFESVLDRCKAQGLQSLPLRWHYRSRHESLITFSNRAFYDGKLLTFPGAVFDAPDLGVEFFRVDGVYDRGGRKDNRIEADTVIDRVLHHRRNHPNRSIGVVALSQPQQGAIEDRIFERCGDEPELLDLQYEDRLAGFFVKNLENVQGDERDIMILSVGYGPDEDGRLTMNFGPMNYRGGERRLNVAVTRARCRFEVVCSFDPDQITAGNPTLEHLRRYLDYARRGVAALEVPSGDSQGDPESPFEEEVLFALRRRGYDVVPQVGAAGYRIDIGVRDPRRLGAYLVGVECDGASYHSSKVARDRDRLRQEVLEGLGWTICRIWSTSWFNNRQAEESRLDDRIRGLLDDSRSSGLTADPTPPDGSPPDPEPSTAPSGEIEVEIEEADFTGDPEWTVPYRQPRQPVRSPSAQRFRFTDNHARPHIGETIVEILRDSPHIHRDVVRRHVLDAWSIGPGGSNIQRAFDRAVARLLEQGTIEESAGFLHLPGIPIDAVRVSHDSWGPKRIVEHVPREELDLAIVELLRDASGTFECEDLRKEWARLFGWARIGTNIRAAFDEAIDRLVAGRRIERRGDSVRLVG